MKREDSPLLPVTQRATSEDVLHGSCCKQSSFCIQSRQARWILLWNFAVLLTYRLLYTSEIVFQFDVISLVPLLISTGFIAFSIFSPVAGLLSDVKWSRYRAVCYSSIAIIVMLLGFVTETLALQFWKQYNNRKIMYVVIGTYTVVFLFAIVYIIFIINAFQFGIDQLHDASTLDCMAYIHWYVWIYHTSSLISSLSWNLILYRVYYTHTLNSVRISGISAVYVVIVVSVTLLIVSLCVFRYKKTQFLLQPAGVNPYKLVYKVTNFARLHKYPLRRSAFTFCTEELPSRMDVGKSKFGGPFTTKQVEDVKAFWGIFKVLLSIGPAFYLQTVTGALLPMFAKHGNVFIRNGTSAGNTEVHLEGVARYILISNGLLSPAVVVACIPLYLWCIRPYIRYYSLATLKRIALAKILMTLSLFSIFVMDLVIHSIKVEDAHCMFRSFSDFIHQKYHLVGHDFFPEEPLYQNVYFFTIQNLLSALVAMLLDVAVYEFICAQSPYSMKGLLIGICFSTRSLFQGLAIILMIPFGHWKVDILSCGSGFYLMNIVIALLALVTYYFVARKYKHRQMDEPSHEYRYAEAYYSNLQ